ncbi:MAG: hypothetical protein GXP26_05740 [Planctomycetes bacterium]|nr:hypothetical protein [Planctomycetota bacterium]
MTIARIGFTILLGCCIATESVQTSWGQILAVGAESTSVGVQQAGGAGDDLGVVEQTSWPSVLLPKITFPKITMPRLWPSTEDDRPALLAPFVVGASKVSQGMRKAWEGTKDIFSAGSGNGTSPAPRGPSFWQRLIGQASADYDDGPQTVGEFMSQKRPMP